MENVTINWSSASVSERKLTVELDGRPSPAWRATAKRVARVLDPGQTWKLKFGKRKLRVSKIAEGSEEELRHFLESVVIEANAAHPGAPDRREQAVSGPDSEMTRRFRSFARSASESRL